jgi:hypothetical protein
VGGELRVRVRQEVSAASEGEVAARCGRLKDKAVPATVIGLP